MFYQCSRSCGPTAGSLCGSAVFCSLELAQTSNGELNKINAHTKFLEFNFDAKFSTNGSEFVFSFKKLYVLNIYPDFILII